MKVLYIGCYRDGTGWAQAAIDYILAMDSAGIDVVPRPLKLNENNPTIPKKLLHLEAKDSRGAEICIQHTLPHLMEYSGDFKKNIALYASETSNFNSSSWARKINMMDEAWVINNQMVDAAKESGVNIPIKVVPHATSFSKFEQDYEAVDIPNSKDNFIFYFVGELNKRKNMEAFIRAFHMEFGKNEPVSILIKSNRYSMSPDQCAAEIKDICDQVKTGIKKYASIDDYKEDLIITDNLYEDDLYALHKSCDCLVMPSYGEAWSIPAFDAMGFGNTPICSNTGGMADYIQNAGILVEGRWEPVYGMTNTFEDLFTSDEDWYSIDVNQLRKSMRKVFEMYKAGDKEYVSMKSEGIKRAKEYSHENIGKLIKDILND